MITNTMDAMTKDIEQQLKDAITASGLPLNAVATLSDTKHASLWRFMRGECHLRLDMAARVAKLFKMELTPPKKPARK